MVNEKKRRSQFPFMFVKGGGKGFNNKGGTTNSQNGINGKKGRNINNSNKNRTASPPAEDDEEGHCHKSAILKNHRLG